MHFFAIQEKHGYTSLDEVNKYVQKFVDDGTVMVFSAGELEAEPESKSKKKEKKKRRPQVCSLYFITSTMHVCFFY